MKGVNETIFASAGDRLYFSGTVVKGVFQILEYIDYCSEMQMYLRDSLKLSGFRQPQGILIVGREQELSEDPRRAKLKGAWNRATNDNIQVRTYDALLGTIENIVSSHEKYSQEKH